MRSEPPSTNLVAIVVAVGLVALRVLDVEDHPVLGPARVGERLLESLDGGVERGVGHELVDADVNDLLRLVPGRVAGAVGRAAREADDAGDGGQEQDSSCRGSHVFGTPLCGTAVLSICSTTIVEIA